MELQESINALFKAEEHEAHSKEDFYKKPLSNLVTLMNIYNKETERKPLVITYIINYPYPKYSYLGFEFLIRIKQIKKSFEYFEKNLNKIRNSNLQYFKEYYELFNLCLARLNFLLSDEEFNVTDITLLRSYVLELSRFFPKKHEKLANQYYSNPEISLNNNLRAEILKKIDLKKAELINQTYNKDLLKEDLKFVVEKIRKMNLDEGIAMAFNKLEEKYYQAKDDNDFAMFGGYIRQTIMGLVKEIAIKIAANKQEIVKERDEHYRNYLKSVGMINEGLWRMLSALYDFLSWELNHNVETDREYYRRGLNITTEIAYLLLMEFEKFEKRKK